MNSGLDVLASEKRGGSHVEGSFKIPREKASSMMAYQDEEVEKSTSVLTGLDEAGSGASSSGRNFSSRRYRDSSGSKASDMGIILIWFFLDT